MKNEKKNVFKDFTLKIKDKVLKRNFRKRTENGINGRMIVKGHIKSNHLREIGCTFNANVLKNSVANVLKNSVARIHIKPHKTKVLLQVKKVKTRNPLMRMSLV